MAEGGATRMASEATPIAYADDGSGDDTNSGDTRKGLTEKPGAGARAAGSHVLGRLPLASTTDTPVTGVGITCIPGVQLISGQEKKKVSVWCMKGTRKLALHRVAILPKYFRISNSFFFFLAILV